MSVFPKCVNNIYFSEFEQIEEAKMDVDSENTQANSSVETNISELLQAQSGDSLLGDIDINFEDSFSGTGEHNGDDPGVSSKQTILHTPSHSLIGDEPSNENKSKPNEEDIPMIDLDILPEDCFDDPHHHPLPKNLQEYINQFHFLAKEL